ncbi:ARM repeat-containing protein [Viridothelium virens]|uniref:ARM repeat-containing protein n=1 Tax=Viridothelium virens TaxID=1048519 RepID=A0A6A6HLC6_VIRVR|nr:ARM repeat-containing protein [Viridothelium virens]
MEDELVNLLDQTQSSIDNTRRQAELRLQQLQQSNEAYPLALSSIAAHDSVPVSIRQAALLNLKTYVLANWSSQFEEFKGQIILGDSTKNTLRQTLLQLATNGREDRKVESAASFVVSKIASADYPSEWPELLPHLLQIIPTGSDGQLHGAIKVLGDLVEECFSESQFFPVARELVKVLYDVAVDEGRKQTLSALATKVFLLMLDTLEILMEDHKDAIKAFADEALNSTWTPFLMNVLKSRLPSPPSEENKDIEQVESYRGSVALKLQAMKVLMRIRSLFPSMLAPQSPAMFSAAWDELSALQPAYHEMYIENERQGRLEDADGLPYTLDFLVLEELDFMQACLRAPPVRRELQQQLQAQQAANGLSSSNWMTEVMRFAFAYAQITTEEEGLWEIDVNIFLSEEISITTNYTPRTACGDLVIKLGEWLSDATVDGLLSYTRTLYSTEQGWKAKEAALYILNQLLGDFQDRDRGIKAEAAHGFVDFIRYAIQQSDSFLRARGYLVAGNLTKTSGDALQQVSVSFMEMSLRAISEEQSEVVKVSCIKALQSYLQALPPAVTLPMQGTIINSLSNHLQTQDLNDLIESEDLLVTLEETLRDAILLDTRVCLDGPALSLLFMIANHGATNFQITMIASETFEEISSTIAALGTDAYTRLCEKVLPSLTGIFDVGSLTQENALTNLAAELLSKLAEHGREPLPHGFVAAVMPKLNFLLLNSTDEELLRSATSAVKFILIHDYRQLFEWRDESGKGGLEVVLVIIDRLLNPSVEDSAAAEVGGLAAEVVEKAGAERLGPFLMQLLKAVAMRLASASQAQFIQSLIIVFARLSLVSAHEVVDFLAQVQVGSENGLQVVMSKWLENSVMFAGYDEIRQNVIALSKLYSLQDPRLSQIMVKGDLIIPQSDRIVTRSRARQNPDQFTIVPAPLKIIKVLVDELLSASGAPRGPGVDPTADFGLDDDDSDDGDWEDDPDTLDLSAGATKQRKPAFLSSEFHPASDDTLTNLAELMAYADEPQTPARQRDDETQAYLIQFFREVAEKPGFGDVFNALSPEEQEKLRSMS